MCSVFFFFFKEAQVGSEEVSTADGRWQAGGKQWPSLWEAVQWRICFGLTPLPCLRGKRRWSLLGRGLSSFEAQNVGTGRPWSRGNGDQREVTPQVGTRALFAFPRPRVFGLFVVVVFFLLPLCSKDSLLALVFIPFPLNLRTLVFGFFFSS